MASFNKIIITGYLGRDPELRHVGQGNSVCNFSIATTEKRNGRGGEAENKTTWFRITAWGKQAELCNNYLAKGRQVMIEGRLSLSEYTDRDGNKRASLEVNATDVHFLERRGDGEEPASSTKREAQAAAHEYQKNPTGQAFDPRPKTLADLVTPKQLWMARNLAREAGLDAGAECLRQYQCVLEEISKRAASELIEYLKGRASGLDSPISQPSGGHHDGPGPDDDVPF